MLNAQSSMTSDIPTAPALKSEISNLKFASKPRFTFHVSRFTFPNQKSKIKNPSRFFSMPLLSPSTHSLPPAASPISCSVPGPRRSATPSRTRIRRPPLPQCPACSQNRLSIAPGMPPDNSMPPMSPTSTTDPPGGAPRNPWTMSRSASSPSTQMLLSVVSILIQSYELLNFEC